MSMADPYSFIRYLEAKEGVDDAALNRRVSLRLGDLLGDLQSGGTVAVLEVGCSIGTRIEWMLDSGLLTRAAYTGIDVEPDNVAEAKRRFLRYADQKNFGTVEKPDGLLFLRRPVW